MLRRSRLAIALVAALTLFASTGEAQVRRSARRLSRQWVRANVADYLAKRGLVNSSKVGIRTVGSSRSGRSLRLLLNMGGRTVKATINKRTGRIRANSASEMGASIIAGYEPVRRRVRLEGSGYGAEVVSFKPGEGSGFNQHRTEVALGRPEGGGKRRGSLHVVSLGHKGQITLRLGMPVRRGLKVFENGFGGRKNVRSPTPALVEVSPDGRKWYRLGKAGYKAVFANSENTIPTRSSRAGGDRLLFSKSLDPIPARAAMRYVRITDSGASSFGTNTRGFDLDAVWGFN